jgi:Zn-dependent protease
MSGGLNYYYTTVAPRPRHGGVSTSRQELTQIGIAYAVLTVDLLIIFSQSTILFGTGGAGLVYSLTPGIVAVAATAALTGFVAHELAHKIVAQRRGFWAEFRMWPAGLALSFVTALIGFLWGAPGATVVSGMGESERAEWGRTSVAGPLANVAFGLAFFAAGVVSFQVGWNLEAVYWIFMLAWINGWFGTFNLVPFGPLDGRKVLRWNAGVWAGAIVLTGAVAAASILAALSMAFYSTPFHCYHSLATCL